MSDEKPRLSQRMQRIEGLRCRHCGRELYADIIVYCVPENEALRKGKTVHLDCSHEAEQELSIRAEARASGAASRPGDLDRYIATFTDEERAQLAEAEKQLDAELKEAQARGDE